MYNTIQFFPNLNALRFFAASLVLLHHGEVIRAKNGFQAFDQYSFFLNGSSAVKFFFVLSGFLITYLLLREKQTTQTVNIRLFYLRRVVRIWPLYFLLVGIGIVLLPFLFGALDIDYSFPYSWDQVWWLFLLFIPSLVTFRYGSHLLEPLWSIGVEEWFYVIWAPLFRWVGKPLVFIMGVLLTKILLLALAQAHIIQSPLAIHLIKAYSFESMAVGGLGAYFLFNCKTDLKIFYRRYRWANYAFLSITFFYIFSNASFDQFLGINFFRSAVFNWGILNLLFINAIIYCAVIVSPNSWLNSRGLDTLGKISYGIYMYHMLVIFTVIHFGKKYLLTLPDTFGFIAFYVLVIGATVLVSYLSKKYFEDFFMRFRK